MLGMMIDAMAEVKSIDNDLIGQATA